MANVALIDLDALTSAQFDSTYADYLLLKMNKDGSTGKPAKSRRRSRAEWSNFVDDFMRACMRTRVRVDAVIAALDTRIDALEAVPAYTPTYANTATVSDTTTTAGVATSVLRSDAVIPHGTRGGGSLHADVIAAGASGFMTGADKTKLDSITTGAGSNQRAVYELDCTAQGTIVLADGANVIDGRSWTVGQSAAAKSGSATTWGFNASGFHWASRDGGAGTLTFNSTTQTAAYLYCEAATLIGSSFDPDALYAFDLYIDSMTLVAAEATRIYWGLWMPASSPGSDNGARARVSAIQTVAGPLPAAGTLSDANTISGGVNSIAAFNTFSCAVNTRGGGEIYMGVGAWAAGWPAYMNQIRNSQTALAVGAVLGRSDARFVISFSHNTSVTTTSAFRIPRIRVRRIG